MASATRFVALAFALLATLVVVSASVPDHSEATNALRQAIAAADSIHKQFVEQARQPEAPAAGEFDTSAVSAECTAALTTFSTAWTDTGCLALRLAIAVSDSATGLGVATQASMAAFCNSTCLTTLQNAVTGISASCSVNVDDRAIFTSTAQATLVLNFQKAIFFSKGVCVQAGGKYCWPQYQTIAIQAQLGYAAATAANIQAACGDVCTPTLLATINTYGYPGLISLTAAAKLICTQVSGTYCAPVMAGIATAVTPGTDGLPNYAALCVPCISAYLKNTFALATAFSGAVDSIVQAAIKAYLAVLDIYCLQAPDGSYCMTKYVDLARSGVDVNVAAVCAGLNPVSGNATCSADCKAKVTARANDLGCCLPVLLGTAAYGARDLVVDTCGVAIKECSGKLVKASIRVLNFLYAYYTANQAAVSAAIAADIALKLGVDVSQVSVSGVVDSSTTTAINVNDAAFRVMSASNTAITASVVVTPGSSSQATSLASAVSTSLASDSSMPSTNSQSPDSKADPASPSTADSTQSTATTETNPNGESNAATAGATASFALVAALVAAITLF